MAGYLRGFGPNQPYEPMANYDGRDVVREEYDPASEESLCVSIVEAIEEHEGTDLARSEFVLYDDVDPDALDVLFEEHAAANTRVQFDTDGVTVSLWGDENVEIAVTERKL